MKEFDKSVKAHLFICCRNKQGKECCHEKGAENMVKNLKKWVKEEGLKKSIKVSQSSCLGQCKEGITACLYPQNKWWIELKPENEKDLKNRLLELSQEH